MSRAAVVARADHQRPGLVLGLPAPGQPRARTSSPPTRCYAEGRRGRRRHRRCCDEFGRRSTRRRRRTNTDRPYQWSYALDLAAPGWSCSTTGAAGCSTPGAPGDAARRPSGTGSPTRRTATTTTWWSARRCRGCCRRRSTTWRPGTSGSPSRRRPLGGGRAEKVRRAVDLEHWAAFRRSFDALAELFAELGAGAGRPGQHGRASTPARRPRSACSPATCTTRTWPAPTSARP